MTIVKAKFAPNDRVRGFVLSIFSIPVTTSIYFYAYILVTDFLGWEDFERNFLFQMAFGIAIISGLFLSLAKHGEAKTLREHYKFLSTSCIIGVLVFGALRVFEEMVVMSATESDKSLYVVFVPVVLVALVELTRREFNRPS